MIRNPAFHRFDRRGARRGDRRHTRPARTPLAQAAGGSVFGSIFPGHGSPAEIASAGAEPFFCQWRQLAIAARRHGRPQRSRFKPWTATVYAFEDSPVNTGRITGTTNFVETNPLPVNEALLQRGRERFDIYCAPCHGRLGDGNGITKKIGVMPAVANLHDKRIVELADGEIFNTVTYGKGADGRGRTACADAGPLGGHRLSSRAAIELARHQGRFAARATGSAEMNL